MALPPKKLPSMHRLQTKWKIDEFLHELLELGVDYSLGIEHTATNEIHFVLKYRKSKKDAEIMSKCLFTAFGR